MTPSGGWPSVGLVGVRGKDIWGREDRGANMYARWGRSRTGEEQSNRGRGGTASVILHGRDHVDVAVKCFELSEAPINQETGRARDSSRTAMMVVKGARPAVGWTLILAGRDVGLPRLTDVTRLVERGEGVGASGVHGMQRKLCELASRFSAGTRVEDQERQASASERSGLGSRLRLILVQGLSLS